MNARLRRLWGLETVEERLTAAERTDAAPVRLRTVQDVLTLLETQLTEVRADRRLGTKARARAVEGLTRLVLKAIEVGQLAARLEALEAVLQARGKSE